MGVLSTVAAHLSGIHSAVKMLNCRIRVLHNLLISIHKGRVLERLTALFGCTEFIFTEALNRICSPHSINLYLHTFSHALSISMLLILPSQLCHIRRLH